MLISKLLRTSILPLQNILTQDVVRCITTASRKGLTKPKVIKKKSLKDLKAKPKISQIKKASKKVVKKQLSKKPIKKQIKKVKPTARKVKKTKITDAKKKQLLAKKAKKTKITDAKKKQLIMKQQLKATKAKELKEKKLLRIKALKEKKIAIKEKQKLNKKQQKEKALVARRIEKARAIKLRKMEKLAASKILAKEKKAANQFKKIQAKAKAKERKLIKRAKLVARRERKKERNEIKREVLADRRERKRERIALVKERNRIKKKRDKLVKLRDIAKAKLAKMKVKRKDLRKKINQQVFLKKVTKNYRKYLDKQKPTQPLNAFMLYVQKNYKPDFTGKRTEQMSNLGQEWRNMTEEQKKPYFDLSFDDAKRYANEKEEFNKLWVRPKRPVTPFFLYLNDIRDSNQLPMIEFTKEGAKKWANLDQSTKQTYSDKYMNSKESYNIKMEKFKEDLEKRQVEWLKERDYHMPTK